MNKLSNYIYELPNQAINYYIDIERKSRKEKKLLNLSRWILFSFYKPNTYTVHS